ncbi:DUF3870 domain-containing protein [Cetobacterium somerae]|uniref:DUF3870 domain-containing protein n=1 Tax=Cetobacterium somerae TaxID=188913 RepID=UPI00248F075D|nr:DUF3870 domain-containing protein [Cetobacterium somerae]
MKEKYIVGTAKTSIDNAITKNYNSFFVGFIIDDNGKILDVEASAILKITNDFIKKIFVGKDFIKDFEEISSIILKNYLGSSQKSIIVAYKDAIKKYNQSVN